MAAAAVSSKSFGKQQIENEIKGCLDFLKYIYTIFGFSFELNLSTRPEKYLGELEVWNKAEEVREEHSQWESWLERERDRWTEQYTEKERAVLALVRSACLHCSPDEASMSWC